MIEVFSPYMLVFLIWTAEQPAETMSMSYSMFADERTCQLAGEKKVQEIKGRTALGQTLSAKAICAPAPSEQSVKWRPKVEK